MPLAPGRPVGPVSRCAKCRKYCRIATTFLFSHVGLCGLVVGYSIVGAFTFEALEAGYELRKREVMLKERQNVIDRLWNITESGSYLSEVNWTLMATNALQNFELTLVKAVRKEGYDGKDESPLQWTFSGALLYSIIVITTIGYGNIAPKTPWGKVVTIFYAIVGIPLLLLCLSNIGDAMAHSFRFIYWKVCCYFCIRPKRRRKKQKLLTSYKPPIVRPSASTNVPKPPSPSKDSPKESPQMSSASTTYYTALENDAIIVSSPTATSPPSSPIATQPPASPTSVDRSPPVIPTYVSVVTNTRPTYYHHVQPVIDTALIPVIPNKYVLHEECDLALASISREVPLQPSTIFSVVTNRSHRPNCSLMIHQPHKTTNSFIWKTDSRGLRNADFDEESAGDVTPEPIEESEVSVPMWLCLTLVLSYICGGAVLFTFWEDWNFLDSSYFCFVTLTTIGFGDLVPGTAVISDDNQLTLGLCSLYLLFGMALLAMSFNLVQEEVTRTMRSIGQRIGIIAEDD